MSKVILENRTKRPPRMLVYNLVKSVAAVKVVNRTTEETRTGERRKKVSTKLVPDSIRIPAGGQVTVSEKALRAPDIKGAIERREIRVKPVKAETPATPQASGGDATSGGDDKEPAPKGRGRRGSKGDA